MNIYIIIEILFDVGNATCKRQLDLFVRVSR